METDGPNIPIDKFSKEDLWALSSLRAFLFDEYRNAPHPEKLSPITISLLQQFDRHMSAAEKTGGISIVTFTNNAFAKVEEPVFRSQELLGELKFRGYPVPSGLIEAKEKGDWGTAEKLLKEFRKNMMAFIANGGKVSDDVNEKLESSNNSGFYLKNWDQVLFCALSRGLETHVKGKMLSEQELIDRGLTKGNISFLHAVSLKGGFIDKAVFSEHKNLSQTVKRLNNSMCEAFQVNEDPIIYNKKARGFKAFFKTSTDLTE